MYYGIFHHVLFAVFATTGLLALYSTCTIVSDTTLFRLKAMLASWSGQMVACSYLLETKCLIYLSKMHSMNRLTFL